MVSIVKVLARGLTSIASSFTRRGYQGQRKNAFSVPEIFHKPVGDTDSWNLYNVVAILVLTSTV
jgi:hypothetical protein